MTISGGHAPLSRLQGVLFPAILFLLTLATRLPFSDPLLYNLDSGHFAFALGRFDVTLHQPHPPGYFLYVMAGRSLTPFTADANAALTLLGAIFSGATVSLTYVAGRSMYGGREGLSAAAIALFSPLLWLHGLVALSYVTECFFSLLTAFLCHRTLKGDGRAPYVSALIIGLAAGFRQSTLLFLMPLWLYSVRRTGFKKVAAACFVMAASFAAWSIPMTEVTGGYERYKDALHSQFYGTVWHGFHLASILENIRSQTFFLTWGLLAALAPLLAHVISRRKDKPPLCTETASPAYYLAWLAPSVLFYCFVFTQGNLPGYSLVYMPAFFLLAGRAVVLQADRFSASCKRHAPGPGVVLTVAVVLVAAANASAFFLLDFNYSLKGIANNNRRLAIYVEAVRDSFRPDDTVLLGWENYYASYRHAAYYLPEYEVYDVIPVLTKSGYRHFLCRDRATSSEKEVDVPGSARYVVFFGPFHGPFTAGMHTVKLKDGLELRYLDWGRSRAGGVSLKDYLIDNFY